MYNDKDPLDMTDLLEHEERHYQVWSLRKLENRYQVDLHQTPYTIKLLLESLLRAVSTGILSPDHLDAKIRGLLNGTKGITIPFMPSRVLLQDFTGVPVLTDLATMRETVHNLGGDPKLVEPVVPTDVVVDHSIRVDVSGCVEALSRNTDLEYQQNEERFRLLRWGERAFRNVRVFPPGTGIVHQINLEYLSPVVQVRVQNGIETLIPDSVCGTDSHTTMINGLGVLGWGVGGIEAESVMLGYPLMIQSPTVTGVMLTGKLRPGVTTTDLVLSLTERLRCEGVVDQFVEFCGEGVRSLSLTERATLANMAPEYGATCAYFPVDDETLRYLRATGRSESQIELVERYYKYQGLYRKTDEIPLFYGVIEFNMSDVVPCVAGPSRPQDRIPIQSLPTSFKKSFDNNSLSSSTSIVGKEGVTIELNGNPVTLQHGSILLAAITSCTNTSNPSVMIAAGLVARNAVNRGLSVPAYVKTSLSPGSKVVSEYLHSSGLMKPLEALGFYVTGYGCMTCSGSSGPIDPQLAEVVKDHQVITTAVLSGNRNFEGRIHPLVRANYLASPPLVIAYAIAGTVCIDLENEPLGFDHNGSPVYLSDIWPTDEEIAAIMASAISPSMFLHHYDPETMLRDPRWNSIPVMDGDLYKWSDNSTYIKKAPYFDDLTTQQNTQRSISGARVLAMLGDSITTDHISPGGEIQPDSPAGRYLLESGVLPTHFNVFGSRRGNHEVMMRGTFSNLRLKNKLVPESEGGITRHYPSAQVMTIYEAAMKYKAENTPLLILAGKDYGCGSSRDWAAKGPSLLGVRAVIAQSFERIHRSNLICMGILPLEFLPNESWSSLGLDGTEMYEITGIEQLQVGQKLPVKAWKENGDSIDFMVRACIDSEDELKYYQHGGILEFVISNLLSAKGRLGEPKL